jgi:hypothetical protein
VIICLWAKSLIDATEQIHNYKLAPNFRQLVEDQQMKFSYWIVLNVDHSTLDDLEKARPKLTIIKGN